MGEAYKYNFTCLNLFIFGNLTARYRDFDRVNIIQKQGLMASKFAQLSSMKKFMLAFSAAGAVGGGGLVLALNASPPRVAASDAVHPPGLPWPHNGLFNSYDHHAIRRGYQVYKQVCAACHSMEYMYYRHLIEVSHSEDEAKAEAAEAQVVDGPDDEGNMFERPGKLSDKFPNPFQKLRPRQGCEQRSGSPRSDRDRSRARRRRRLHLSSPHRILRSSRRRLRW